MLRRVTTLLLAIVVAGCGYSTRGNLPEHIKTVAVPILRNKTLESGIETTITSAIVAAFGARLRVVPIDRADAVLDGEVVGYTAQGVSFNLGANVNAYRVTIVVNIEFRDARQNTVLWKEVGLTQTSDFSVQGSISDTIARQVGSTGQAAEQLGHRIVNAVTERF
jgi:outer membrane lipopolysaccharide assembly protein LptE/RlpB